MNRLTKQFLTLAVPILILNTACLREPEALPNTPKGNFEALWRIIDTRYCYLDYKSIDWDSIYTVYSNRVDTTRNNFAFFDLMASMLAELKDGHVNLYSDFDRSRYTNWYSDYPSNFNSNLLNKERYLGSNYRIAGGMRYKSIADNQVGYIHYSSFSNSFSNANISAIFTVFAGCKGLIIDVRSNGGGTVSNSEMLASFFFQEKTLTNHITHKIGNGHSDFSTPKPIYTTPHPGIRWERPVVILVNRMSFSATNDFICRMKYAPNSTIIGDKSGGGGGLPLSSEMPNGWMVRFSASPMLNANKENIEWGIDPDIRVDMSKADEAKGEDTIIEKAIEIIKSK